MGIPNFLPLILESVGRSIDLRTYCAGILDPPPPPTLPPRRKEQQEQQEQFEEQQSKRRCRRRHRRPLRLGIDISSWIYSACLGYGDMLADDRFLTNLGRASLLQELLEKQQQEQQQPQEPCELSGNAAACQSPTKTTTKTSSSFRIVGSPAKAVDPLSSPSSSPSSKRGRKNDAAQDEMLLRAAAAAEARQKEYDARIQKEQTLRKEEQIRNYIAACTKRIMDRLKLLQVSCQSEMDEDCGIEILVVLDGATPPIKTRQVVKRSMMRKQATVERDQAMDIDILTARESSTTRSTEKDSSLFATNTTTTTDDSAVGATTTTTTKTSLRLEESKQRRFRANRRAGAGDHFGLVVQDIVTKLRHEKIPFLVAPYEADGQLAYLIRSGYIDCVVTEDSDLIATGASPILYKLSESLSSLSLSSNASASTARACGSIAPTTTGKLVRRQDWGACTALPLQDFTPAMMAVLFVAVGSDYGDTKLPGIGIVRACALVRQAFLPTERTKNPLEVFFDKLFRECWESETTLTPSFKEAYIREFVASVHMYQHPIVYDPVLAVCIPMGVKGVVVSAASASAKSAVASSSCQQHDDDDVDDFTLNTDPELQCFGPYAELCRDRTWRNETVGTPILCPLLATAIAEGWISPRTLRPFLQQQQQGESAQQDKEEGAAAQEEECRLFLPDYVYAAMQKHGIEMGSSAPPPMEEEEQQELLDDTLSPEEELETQQQQQAS